MSVYKVICVAVGSLLTTIAVSAYSRFVGQPLTLAEGALLQAILMCAFAILAREE